MVWLEEPRELWRGIESFFALGTRELGWVDAKAIHGP